MTLKRMDNVLIVVEDLEAVKAFFIELDLKLDNFDSMKESGPPGMMAVYGVSLVRIAKVRPFMEPGGPRYVVRRHRPASQAIDRERSRRVGKRADSQTSQHRVAEGAGVLQ